MIAYEVGSVKMCFPHSLKPEIFGLLRSFAALIFGQTIWSTLTRVFSKFQGWAICKPSIVGIDVWAVTTAANGYSRLF